MRLSYLLLVAFSSSYVAAFIRRNTFPPINTNGTTLQPKRYIVEFKPVC